jgi:ribosomal-protein-alanine N-acetyltransferase
MARSRTDGNDLPLSLASLDDAEALALMSRDLIEKGLGWAYRPTRIARMIGDSEATTVVARDGRVAAGFAMMTFAAERAHLVLLAVGAKYQRRGIARRMIAWLRESALTAGIASIHVELRAGNPAAYATYLAAGFTEILRLPGYYGGRETAVRMICSLRTHDIAPQTWRPPTLDRR